MQFFVDKSTDLMRSTFTAVGLAQLLYRIPPVGSGQEVTLRDMGSCYVIESKLGRDALTAHIADTGRLPAVLPAIFKPLTSKEQKLAEAGTPIDDLRLKYVPRGFAGTQVDYADERSIAQAASKRKRKRDAPRAEDDAAEAHPDYPVWAHLCSYFGKGSAMRVGYPTVVHNWHAHEREQALMLWELICDCYQAFPNGTHTLQYLWETELLPELDYADADLIPEISALAIVSPSTSKGVSAMAGYNKLTEDTPNAFWLEMYFAFAGYMQVALPFNLGSDVMMYYPIPHDIEITQLAQAIKTFRDSRAGRDLYRFSNSMPRIRVDPLAVLGFYQTMIRHQLDLADKAKEGDSAWLGWSPGIISGMVGYYYKNIATQIPFDETTFALPAWLPTGTLNEDALDHADQILEQHRYLVEGLRGKPPQYKMTADEINILDLYRRYLTHGQGWDWIEFAIAYGQYRFRVLPDIPKFPMLTVTLIKESFPMNTHLNDRIDFRSILENPGVQNIGAAINHCTAYARYKKDVQRDSSFGFKVRHGLGDDLLRNAHDPALFIEDLSRFILDYQQESSSVQARSKQTRPAIQPGDIHEVTGLVAEYGSRVVAHLLVAVGYASRFDLNKSSN